MIIQMIMATYLEIVLLCATIMVLSAASNSNKE